MDNFTAQVQALKEYDVYAIQTQYDAAMDSEHGSGEHWLLIATLNQLGFPCEAFPKLLIQRNELSFSGKIYIISINRLENYDLSS